MQEKFAEVHRSIDRASEIAKSLMAEYEESERIASRMEAIFMISCDFELGSWLTRFRIVRKMKGGRWELWRCPFIDLERWVRVNSQKLESTGAPDGITIQSVEIHRR